MGKLELLLPQQKQLELRSLGWDNLLCDPSEVSHSKGGLYRVQTFTGRKKYFTLAPTAKSNSQGLLREEVRFCVLTIIQLQNSP